MNSIWVSKKGLEGTINGYWTISATSGQQTELEGTKYGHWSISATSGQQIDNRLLHSKENTDTAASYMC